MTPLEKRQEEMRTKFRERRLTKMRKQMAKATAAIKKNVPPVPVKRVKAVKLPRLFILRASEPGDHSAEKLDRMEELAYRIARRKWQKCL